MKLLLKNADTINVFTDEVVKTSILISDGIIVGVGPEYTDADAEGGPVRDLEGAWVAPGFIDGHIHIESTMLLPRELSDLCITHGTTAVVADPHEIANVCGADGIRYMLSASSGLPMKVYICIPSCVPASPFDESGAVLTADDIRPFYGQDRILGLAEMMNYPGVLGKDPDVLQKIRDAKERGLVINGHAPMLSGRELDAYIAAGVGDDHECASMEEAVEKLKKGQWIMVRQGTSARNLENLIGIFDEPYNHRALIATDDKHPADLMEHGHIDGILREAVRLGADPIVGIRMATIQAALCLGLHDVGAIAPGYRADLVVLDDLDTISVRDVYAGGVLAAKDKKAVPLEELEQQKTGFFVPRIPEELSGKVHHTFHISHLGADDFKIPAKGIKTCRVIGVIPGQLITDELHLPVDFDHQNGISTKKDILKLAVCERHHGTGHIGLGFIHGIGLSEGAIASSVSHDSHNLIVIGTNEEDMAMAAEEIRRMGGGNVFVAGGSVISAMELPVAGLMSEKDAKTIAAENAAVRSSLYSYGVPDSVEPFMNMAFVSLPVIPHLKMTTQGLVDVTGWKRVPLFT